MSPSGWLHTVGRWEVAELRGSLETFARGAVVTTSCFSRAAIDEATGVVRQPVVLIDGYQFALTVRSQKLISAGFAFGCLADPAFDVVVLRTG